MTKATVTLTMPTVGGGQAQISGTPDAVAAAVERLRLTGLLFPAPAAQPYIDVPLPDYSKVSPLAVPAVQPGVEVIFNGKIDGK